MTQGDTHLKRPGRGGARLWRLLLLLLQNALAGVAAGSLLAADAPQEPSALLAVGGAALAGVAAHAVLTAARLQDGLPRDVRPVHQVHEHPAAIAHTR